MASGSFVTYSRVSTARQGVSGLGLEAQQVAVSSYLNGGDWKIVGQFVEVESGKNNDRVELAKAIRLCRLYGAKLLIAKLDRLSRDAHFLLGLEKAGIDFVCCDMPSANRLTIGIMAMVAEEERRMISARTKAALQAAKARGVKLGGVRNTTVNDNVRALAAASRKSAATARAMDVLPMIEELQGAGITSLSEIARVLTERGVPTAKGAATWSPMQVSRAIKAGKAATA